MKTISPFNALMKLCVGHLAHLKLVKYCKLIANILHSLIAHAYSQYTSTNKSRSENTFTA